MSDLFGAGAGVISSILNYYSNERTNQANIAMQESANQANRQLAAEQRQWDLDMWNRQNAYNDPAAQVSRLRAAGINPALAYAQGGMMNESAPAQEAAGSRDLAAQVRPYYQDPLVAAQIANLAAQTDKTDAEAAAITSKLPEEIQTLQQQRKESEAKIGELNQQVATMQQQISNMQEDRKLTIQRQVTEAFNRELASADFERRSKETVASIRKMAQDVLESQARTSLTKEQERAVVVARHLDEQEYAFLQAANGYRLLGLKLDNDLKVASKTLYEDQNMLNQMQSVLLGFQIEEGKIDARRNALWSQNVAGSAFTASVDQFLGELGQLISPLKGLLSIGIK